MKTHLRSCLIPIALSVLLLTLGCSDSANNPGPRTSDVETVVESKVSEPAPPSDRALPPPPPVVEQQNARQAMTDRGTDAPATSDAPATTKTSAASDSPLADRPPATDDATSDTQPIADRENAGQPAAGKESAPTADDVPRWDPDAPTAEELAAKAFLAPPDSKPLSKQGRLWVDLKRKRVYVDGYVALRRGALEMFACPVGTKEHESIVAALAKSREVHAALLAVDATPGSPVRFRPEFSPPTGQVIRVWVCWYDPNDQFHAVDARQWIEDLEVEKAMTAEWVFAGSGFWEDPEDKREYYRADSGDMICVSNFQSAMLDVSIPSSADAGSLRFVPLERNIPALDTPVRLILVPVPPASGATDDNASDSHAADGGSSEGRLDLPTAKDVPRAR